MINVTALTSAEFKVKLWHVFVPPMWFAAPLSILIDQGAQTVVFVMAILGITVPILLLFFLCTVDCTKI